ncbi:MAG: LacI family DNA-binding transcriptional regulator [Actinomycetales bacterium]
MSITIRDVAAAAGVSTATVSRALRGLPNVDEATRQRVRDVATHLDYVISPSASRLASGRTGSVAVITPAVSRWFFATVLSGVESVLQDAGVDLLLQSTATSTISPARLRGRVDGVLAISVPPEDPQLQRVIDLGLPTSLIGTWCEGAPSVMIDDVQAAVTATKHLIDQGHHRIGLISGSADRQPATPSHARRAGFLDVMNNAGLEPSLEAGGYFTIDGGEQAMEQLLSSATPPTAVFAMSDEMAFGAMRALRRHGLTPGQDVALVGIDGHDMSEYLELTTVAQPVVELGRIAATWMLEQLADGPVRPVESILVPTTLLVRGSSGRPRS